jgi:hypothetical protein
MKNVYKPKSGTELALLKSLLVGEDIPFNVVNDGFGSLEVGPQIGLFNERIIQVPDEHAARAEEVIRDFLAATADVAPTENFSFFEKVIGVAESWVRKWRSLSRR